MLNQMESSTETRLIGTARRLFAEQGYGGTSVAAILEGASANSGSLYHYFPTKQDLLIAVLDGYLEGMPSMLLEPAWAGVDDPIERVFALLAAYRAFLGETDCSFACPIGSLALELRAPDPAVREKLAANFSIWAECVERCLVEAQSERRLPPEPDAKRLSRFVLTTMEGAVMLARTYGSLAAFDDSIRCLRDYFDRLGAASPRRRARSIKRRKSR
jgi:AcrR family transcriptional regulator